MIRLFRKYQLVFLWPLTVVIIASMFVWGSPWDTGGADPDRAVGAIRGEKVTLGELQGLQRKLGLPASGRAEDLEPLFWGVAFERFVESQGIVASPDLVTQYAQLYQRGGASDETARIIAREAVLRAVFQRTLEAGADATDLECYREFQHAEEERKVRYVRLAAKDLPFLADAAAVEKAAIERYYEERKDRPAEGDEPGFRIDERIRFEAAFLPLADVEASVAVSAEEVEKAYEADKETRYRKPPPETAAPEGATPVAAPPPPAPEHVPLAEVRAEIEKRLRTEKAAKRLAELLAEAHDYTGDRVSFPEDLPTVAARFKMRYVASAGPCTMKDLEKVEKLGDLSGAARDLFTARVGEARRAAPLPEGGLLFRVLERLEASRRPLAEVEGEIRDALHREKVFEKAREAADWLKTEAEKSSLERAAENLFSRWKDAHKIERSPLSIQTTDFFKASDASVAGVGASYAFRQAAFSLARPRTEEERRRERPGDPTPPGHAVADDPFERAAYVVAVAEFRAPDLRSFADRKERLRQALAREKVRQLRERLEERLRDPAFAEFTLAKEKKTDGN